MRLKEIINASFENDHITKKLCFINNVRSKYLTIGLLIISVLLTIYDVVILQKIESTRFFLLNFKSDLILLVAAFIFMVYIFFNQVKSHKEIKHHHKLIHGIITLSILFWSAFKSIIYVEVDSVNLIIFIAAISLLSILYLFPLRILIVLLFLTLIFYILCTLIYNFHIDAIITNLFYILFFSMFSLITSSHVYILRTRIILKDQELKQHVQNNN